MLTRRPVVFVTALIAAGVGLSLSLYPGPRSASANYNLLLLNQIAGLRRADLAFGLHTAGLTPESLAAAGIDADHATAVVAAAAAHMGGDVEAVSMAQAHLGRARNEVERLERLVRRGAGVHEQGLLSAARAELAGAQSDFDSVIAAVRRVALAPLSAGQRARLDAIRPNLDRPVPAEFKFTARSDEEWTRLRDALSNEAQAGSRQAAADDAAADLLAETRAETQTAAARSAHDAYRDDVESAFAAAITALAG